MSKKDPAMLFYTKDWLEGTAEMLPIEKGVYIDLLAHQHQKGSLPIEPFRLAKLVGLSEEEFSSIWEYLKVKFEQDGNRMVNQKLREVMTERSTKSYRNAITGTFASVLKFSGLNQKDYKYVKKMFDIEQFIGIPKEKLSESITEWLTVCLKNAKESIEDVNEDYIILLDKNIKEFNITKKQKELLLTWLKYKSEKGQSYKSIGMKSLIKSICKLSEEELELSIEKSITNNWAGLFPDKKEVKKIREL